MLSAIICQQIGLANIVLLIVGMTFGVATVALLVLNIPQYSILSPCNISSSSDIDENNETVTSWLGVGLTIIGNIINALGISVQKYAHLRLGALAPTDAYFRDYRWWIGLVLVAIGESLNAVAYGFAPTSIVAPLGGLTLIITDAIAIGFFKEKLRFADVCGGVLILLGVGLSTSSTSDTTRLYTAYELLSPTVFGSPQSAVWFCILLISVPILLFSLGDRARENVSIWAVTAALVSSFTVIACRGFFSMLALAPDDCAGLLCDAALGQQRVPCTETVANWLFWFLLGVILVTAFVANAQLEQRGLRYFAQSLWVPMHFAFCTILFTISGAIVFGDFDGMSPVDIALFALGFVLLVTGAALILTLRLNRLPRCLRAWWCFRVVNF